MENLQSNNSKYEKIKLAFLSFIAIFLLAFAMLFGAFNAYKDYSQELKQINQSQVFSDGNIVPNKVKNTDKKLSRTEHSISVGSYNAFVGTMGTIDPYSVTANTYITLDFEKNDETLGDYHFSYIVLKNIQLNVMFFRYNHNNFETEYIGQIANSYSVTAQDFNASVDYWFNLVETLEVLIIFENIDYGSSNEFDFYINFYAYDLEENETIYTFNRHNQFQYTKAYNITYLNSISYDNEFMPWIDLFISNEVYDFWYNKGFNDGEDAGREIGYREGFNAGSGTTATDNAFTFIWSTISNATNSVLNVFNFQILPGIPLYTFIMIPVIISILFFILKVVKK